MAYVPLHNYLRTHRRRRCLSQTEVAYLLGRKRATSVSRHEAGYLPDAPALLAYRLIYQVPLDKLIAGAVEDASSEVRGRAVELIERIHAEGMRGPRVDCKLRNLGAVAFPEDPVIEPVPWSEY